uniref:Hva1_TUDOR domain-containing protein n=1 Tax=Angiostrongylus cantonensis TaxID=6313 RepID=A0A0K0DD66_ANGCA
MPCQRMKKKAGEKGEKGVNVHQDQKKGMNDGQDQSIGMNDGLDQSKEVRGSRDQRREEGKSWNLPVRDGNVSEAKILRREQDPEKNYGKIDQGGLPHVEKVVVHLGKEARKKMTNGRGSENDQLNPVCENSPLMGQIKGEKAENH